MTPRRIGIVFLAASAALCAPAQQTTQDSFAASIFGSGEMPRLSYAHQSAPRNLLLFDSSYEAAYDDNPLAGSGNSLADEEQNAGAHAALLHQSPSLDLMLEYSPYYQAFHHYSEYNRFSQNLGADASFKASEAWTLRLRNDFATQSGSYAAADTIPVTGDIGAPTGLNQTIYAPMAKERTETARMDVLHEFSARSSFDLFAAYDQRNFSQAQQPLYSTRGGSGGGEYAWRAREHTTLGVLGFYQNMRTGGALPAGSASRMGLVSVLPTVGWRPRPEIELTAFGGPQIASLSSPSSATANSSTVHKVQWAAGGSFTDRTERAALVLSGQHFVTDGGGLMNYVAASQLNAAFLRRLVGKWDMSIELGVARNNWISLTAVEGHLTSEMGTARFSREMNGHLGFQARYEYVRQTSSGDVDTAAEFHRNRAVAGVTWRWASVPLSR